MGQKRNVRKIYASVAMVVVSAVLLIGLTFAWFTDSVTNKGNKIQSGTLDIELTTTGDSGIILASDGQWEPGYSEKANATVSNKGSLWLKYGISVENLQAEGSANLAEVLDVYVVDANAQNLEGAQPVGTIAELAAGNVQLAEDGALAPNGYTGNDGISSKTLNLVVKMRESAGNEYQGSKITFDIVVKATQSAKEQDGFGSDQYDADAPLDFKSVSTADELKTALEAGESVVMTQDIQLTDRVQVTKDVTIQGNGNKLVASKAADRVINVMNTTSPVTLTLSGVNVEGPTSGTYTRGISLYNAQGEVNLVVDNCSVSAGYYAINLASACPNVKATIKNTTIAGWTAFQTHSPNADVTFEGCTLIGLNDKGYNADGWNDFATLVINTWSNGNPDHEGAHDTKLTLKNCRIEANQTTGNRQYYLSVRSNNNTIVIDNCTFWKDGVQQTVEEAARNVSVYGGTTGNSIVVDGVNLLK